MPSFQKPFPGAGGGGCQVLGYLSERTPCSAPGQGTKERVEEEPGASLSTAGSCSKEQSVLEVV